MSKIRFSGALARDWVFGAGGRERRTAMSAHALSYGVAVLSVAAATLLRFELQSLLGNYARFLPSVLAVMFSAWYGGLGPGLLATGPSALPAGYLSFSPVDYPLSMGQPRDVVQLTMFCSIGVMISSLSGTLRAEV